MSMVTTQANCPTNVMNVLLEHRPKPSGGPGAGTQAVLKPAPR